MGTSADLWKGFAMLFAAGVVAGWLLIGVIWGLVLLVHHLHFMWK